MKTIVHLVTVLFILLAGSVTAQKYQDTLITVGNTKLHYEYDVSWTKDVKSREIEQFIKNQMTPSFKSSSQILSILQNIKVSQDPCFNSGFESGYSGWTGLSLKHGITTLPIENGLILNPGVLALPYTGLGSGQNFTAIETVGTDALLLASTPSFSMSKTAPGSLGTQSLRLGNNQPGYGAEGVAKRFVVTPANAKYYFQYAMVMDKSHSNTDGTPNGTEVFFVAEAVDMSGVTIDKIVDVAAPSNPFISTTNSPTEGVKYYRNWRCAYLDLSSHIGQEVVVMFINSDCSAGAHNGYTYIDETCTTCKNTSEGTIDLSLKGRDCIEPKQTFNGTFTVPALASNVSISFEIYQSGTLLNTIPATTVVGSNYTIDVTATDFPIQTVGTCYDVVAKLTFDLIDLNGNVQTVVQYSTKPVLGVQYGQVAGLNNDICFCDNDLGSFCCDADNLVSNGNFEAGNTGFSSAYSLNAATNPGQYNVINTAAAFGAAVTDHSYCVDPVTYASNSRYLTVNGKTQQSGSSVIWEQTITGLRKGETYRFCANFKNMKQCTFDILPKVRMEAGTTSSPVFTINMATTNACAWQNENMTFTASGTTETIRIYLDEMGNGDGNDLAIDDIYVGILSDPGLAITVQHDGTNNAIIGSVNTISTTDDTIKGDCRKYHWFVAEVSSYPSIVIDWSTFAHGNNTGSNLPPFAGTPSLIPWNLTTTFPGYAFANNKLYIVGMYTPECECYASDFTYQLTFNTTAKNAVSTKVSDEQREQIIDAILNGLKADKIDVEFSKEVAATKSIEIYPNPVKEEFVLSVSNEMISKVIISDMAGKIVKEQSFSSRNSDEKVNVSQLIQGVYFVKLLTNKNTYDSKMIKN
ncbi:T9SS type A sorting domain-containing protein [Flavobacterium faecale]|uniref:T9SS type A sorting domain-containing protein n=1 Tax=Flavobacterium faecale TaxID=1355330 RepID=UPI003AAEB72A